MKGKKESAILIAIAFTVVGILSLFLNNRSRFFTEYIYDEIAAWQEQKEVHAMENPEEAKDQTEEDEPEDQITEPLEPEETMEPTEAAPDMEDSVEGPSEQKYENKDSDKSNESEESDEEDEDDKEIVTNAPLSTEVPNLTLPNQTDLPHQMEVPIHTEIPTEAPTEAPTPSPVPTQAPTQTPKASPTPTPKPTETPVLVSISAKWPDKDNILYKSEIDTKTLKVTGKMSNNEEVSIDVKKCSLIGLESKSLGEHTMIIKYDGLSTTLLYTIVRGGEYTLGYEWDVSKNKGKCFKGEDISKILLVYKQYNDNDFDYIDDYSITGIDFNKLGKQTGVISYEGKTKFITCEIVEKQYVKIAKYCNSSGDIIHENREVIDVAAEEKLKINAPDSNLVYESEEYTLSSTLIKVDGSDKEFPYTMRDRDMLAEVTAVYVKNN